MRPCQVKLCVQRKWNCEVKEKRLRDGSLMEITVSNKAEANANEQPLRCCYCWLFRSHGGAPWWGPALVQHLETSIRGEFTAHSWVLTHHNYSLIQHTFNQRLSHTLRHFTYVWYRRPPGEAGKRPPLWAPPFLWQKHTQEEFFHAQVTKNAQF